MYGKSSSLLRIILVAAFICAAVAGFLPAKAQAAAMQADKIVVDKSARRLTLMKDGSVLKIYRISLGYQPEGAKTRRGDGRTPEGRYTIDSKNAYSRFHLALHVSYPSASDAYRARRLGVSPGGNIMVHGLPNGHGPRWAKKQFTDWTAGCIALNDQDMNEIWRAVPVGTPIEIRP